MDAIPTIYTIPTIDAIPTIYTIPSIDAITDTGCHYFWLNFGEVILGS